MGYNRENYIRIREEYAGKNLLAREAAERRADELHAKSPDLAQLDRLLAETGVKILGEAMRGKEGLDERIAKLREENSELLAVRAELLETLGYPADYTAVKYECPTCQDTGFIGTKMCSCMRRKLILAGYESSGIGRLIEKQSFETFRLDYYRQSPEQQSEMEHTFNYCRDFAEHFQSDWHENLLLFGSTGLGKTHLSTSIAKVVIERGFDVVYDTMQNIMSDFEYERFGRGYGDSAEPRTSKYFDCDLLIIDDLGSEMTNQFTISCLYNIVNIRLNHSRSLVVSTNLEPSEIRARYGDRITSRFFGEYTLLRFTGLDVRMQKMQHPAGN